MTPTNQAAFIRTIGLIATLFISAVGLVLVGIYRPGDGPLASAVVNVLGQIAISAAGAIGVTTIADAVVHVLTKGSNAPVSQPQNQHTQTDPNGGN